jgi:16S rRNA (cytosine967-C5)-methyltransferase
MASRSRPKRSAAGALVRAQAARVDARVVTTGVTAEAALADAALCERDAPLLRAIVHGALRWHHRLEWQLAQLLRRPLARTDAELAALLRVGLVQLQALRVPEHAAVSATVEACGLLGRAHARGLVNAVLRRFVRERADLLARGDRDDEARLSHPAWLIALIRGDWGATSESILAANNAPPPMWLRVNRRVTDPAQYVHKLRAQGIEASLCERARSAVLLAAPQPTSTIPGYSAGEVSVQDGAAQLAASFMNLRPGLRVLDACAAPGGKTAHILESCPDLGAVVALDRDRARLATVAENLARLNLTATLLHADAVAPRDWWDGRPFDRILLDAPCSALGVIRRHPDIKVLRKPGDVDAAVDLQARLLESLWPLLAPAGELLYATCTVLRRENAAQIENFRAQTPNAMLVGPAARGDLQVLPGEATMDGFYYACLRKQREQ